jgi:hypothetical protein
VQIDAQTGTVSGRAEAEVEKSRFTVTVSNEVNATQASFTFMSLRPPTALAYQYPSTIYKEGRLRLGAWTAARAGLLRKLGKDVTADNLLDLTVRWLQYPSNGSNIPQMAPLPPPAKPARSKPQGGHAQRPGRLIPAPLGRGAAAGVRRLRRGGDREERGGGC